MKESGEIFAQFTMSKVRKAFEDEPLTDTQIEKLHQVLVANEPHQKHSLDIRLTLPLLFRKYYIIIFAGRDRRRNTLEREQYRKELVNKTGVPKATDKIVNTVFYALLAFVTISVLYTIKSVIGIDLFSDFHLSEWFFKTVDYLFGK